MAVTTRPKPTVSPYVSPCAPSLDVDGTRAGFSIIPSQTAKNLHRSLRHLSPLSYVGCVLGEYPSGTPVNRWVLEVSGMAQNRTTGTSSHLLTVPEALDCLRISRGTFYKEVNAGRLLVVKVGRATRVSSSSLANFIDAKETEARQLFVRRYGRWS